MPVDISIQFTVVFAVPALNITRLECVVRHAGVDTTYDLLPIGTKPNPYAQDGDTIFIVADAINNGGVGTCFLEVYTDATLLWSCTDTLSTGQSFGIVALGKASAFPFTMPNSNVAIRVDAGHS